MPYKTAFIISSMNRGGAELRLVGVLRGLDRNLFEPVLFVAKGGGDLLSGLQDVKVVVGDEDARNIVYSLPALWNFVRAEKPHVIWSIQPHFFGLISRLFALIHKVPVILLSIHGQEHPDKPVTNWLNRIVTKIRTDGVVVVTEAMRHRVVEEGVPNHLIFVQYNGVNNEVFFPHPNKSRHKAEALGVSPNTFTVGIVAGLRSVKAHEVFIQAAYQAIKQMPNIQFFIIGDGERRTALERLTEELDLKDRVLFLGHRTDIPDLMRALDVFVLTSDTEGCSNVLLEAMATGLPIITTDFESADEFVDEEIGIIVPRRSPIALAEALIELLKDAGKRAKMSKAARKRALEKFSCEKMIHERETLLKNLLIAKGIGSSLKRVQDGR